MNPSQSTPGSNNNPGSVIQPNGASGGVGPNPPPSQPEPTPSAPINPASPPNTIQSQSANIHPASAQAAAGPEPGSVSASSAPSPSMNPQSTLPNASMRSKPSFTDNPPQLAAALGENQADQSSPQPAVSNAADRVTIERPSTEVETQPMAPVQAVGPQPVAAPEPAPTVPAAAAAAPTPVSSPQMPSSDLDLNQLNAATSAQNQSAANSQASPVGSSPLQTTEFSAQIEATPPSENPAMTINPAAQGASSAAMGTDFDYPAASTAAAQSAQMRKHQTKPKRFSTKIFALVSVALLTLVLVGVGFFLLTRSGQISRDDVKESYDKSNDVGAAYSDAANSYSSSFDSSTGEFSAENLQTTQDNLGLLDQKNKELLDSKGIGAPEVKDQVEDYKVKYKSMYEKVNAQVDDLSISGPVHQVCMPLVLKVVSTEGEQLVNNSKDCQQKAEAVVNSSFKDTSQKDFMQAYIDYSKKIIEYGKDITLKQKSDLVTEFRSKIKSAAGDSDELKTASSEFGKSLNALSSALYKTYGEQDQ